MNEVIDMGSIGESTQTTWNDVTAASADNETRAKLEARFPPRKEKRIVEVKLTAEERAEKGNELAALVQEIEPGTGFADSVYRLSGAPSVAARPAPAPVVRQPPQMPAQGREDVVAELRSL